MLDIRNIDCMELMKQYPDKYFDLAICDPPYTDEFRVVNSGECAKLGDYKTDSLNNNAPTDEYFKEVIRVSKNQIIWGVNYYKFYLGVGRIVWDKDNTGNYSDCELAYHSFGNVVRKFKWRWNGMLQGDMKDKQIRIHPTEKPKQLYSWILKKYAKQNDKILDTHFGSGSIALALDEVNKIERMNLSLTASEIDKEHFEKAIKRIKEKTAQLGLSFNH
jgi:site-specific DNA-methyltransferase (adenine-specific)